LVNEIIQYQLVRLYNGHGLFLCAWRDECLCLVSINVSVQNLAHVLKSFSLRRSRTLIFPFHPILYRLPAYLYQKDDPALTWISSRAINLLFSPAIHVLLPSLTASHTAFYLLPTNLQRYKMDYSHIKVIMSYGAEKRPIQGFGEDQCVDMRTILRWIFREWWVGAWTGSSWLRIGTGGGHL